LVPERISALLKKASEYWQAGNAEQSAMHLRILLGDLDRLLTPIRRRGHEDRPPIIPADAFGREKVRLLRSSCAEALSLLHRDPSRAWLMLDRAIQLSGLTPQVSSGPTREAPSPKVEPAVDNIRYYGFDQMLRETILETVRRLPEGVAKFVSQQCSFVSVGPTGWGMAIPGNALEITTNTWFIVLEERMPLRSRHSIVAREIAYAWLGHDRLSPACDPASETQALGLTAAWGFKGRRSRPEPEMLPEE
jgi:hypothetical protein